MRYSNKESSIATYTKTEFQGSNLSGKWIDKCYVVFSYDWYPIYVYKNSKWYGNDTSYSITTAKQMTQSMPISKEKITYLTTNELENLYKIK